jgi:hypothetical protein
VAGVIRISIVGNADDAVRALRRVEAEAQLADRTITRSSLLREKADRLGRGAAMREFTAARRAQVQIAGRAEATMAGQRRTGAVAAGQNLRAQVTAAENAMTQLALRFEKTGDASVLKAFNKQSGLLSRLRKLANAANTLDSQGIVGQIQAVERELDHLGSVYEKTGDRATLALFLQRRRELANIQQVRKAREGALPKIAGPTLSGDLATQIKTVEAELAHLGAAYSRTGDTATRAMFKQRQGVLRDLKAMQAAAGHAVPESFGKDLRKQIRSVHAELKNLAKEYRRTGDAATLIAFRQRERALRDLRAVDKATTAALRHRRAGGDGGGFDFNFGTLGRQAAIITSRFTLFTGAAVALAPTLIHVTNAVAPLVGGLVGIPAALLATVAVVGVFKLATVDMKKALSAGILGDAVAYAKAMKKLPPPTRQFVQTVLSLRGPLRNLRSSVSAGFFGPFVGQVRPLAQAYLPMARRGLTGVGSALGGIVGKFAKAARAGTLFGGIKAVLANTAAGLVGAGSNTAKFTDAIGRLLKVGAPSIKRIGVAFGAMTGRFADFIERADKTGKLKRWLDNAFTTLNHIDHIARNVFRILRSIFGAGGDGRMLQRMEAATKRWDAFLRSTAGSGKLKAVFSALDRFGKGVSHTLGSVAHNAGEAFGGLAPTIGAFLPVIGKLVRSLAPLLPAAGGFGRILTTAVLPPLTAITNFLERHEGLVRNIGRLALIVVTTMGIWKSVLWTLRAGLWLYIKALEFVEALQVLINSTAFDNPYVIAAVAVAALVGLLVVVIAKNDELRARVIGVWRAIVRALGTAAGKVRDFFEWFYTRPKAIIEAVAAKMRGLGQAIVDGFVEGLKATMTRVTGFVGNVIHAIERKLGVHSPSRVTFAIGQQVGDGLALGIRSKVGAVRKALTNVVKVATGLTARSDVRVQTTARTVATPAQQNTAITIHVAAGVDPAEVGRRTVAAIEAWERRSGKRRLAAA